MIERDCVECGAPVQGDDLTAFGLAGLAHVRAAHPEMPYPAMAAGWINVSMRSGYTLFRRGDNQAPTPIGIACFAIAPPYRKHGLARQLLTKVVDDAPSRGANVVEAYPLHADVPNADGFRGS